MWMLYGGVAGVMLILLIMTAGVRVEEDWQPEGIYRVFLRCAIWIQKNKPVGADRELYRRRTEKISAFLFCCSAGAVFALMVMASVCMDRRVDDEGYVRRNAYGEGSMELQLEAVSGEKRETIQIELAEEKLTEEELEKMILEVVKLLPDVIKAENTSLDQVTADLYFPTELDGYPFSFHWESEDYGRISSDGKVKAEGISESGELVGLTAELSYEDWTWTEKFQVRICRLQQTPSFREELKKAVEQSAEAAEYEQYFLLPMQVGTEFVIWEEKIQDNSSWIFLVFVLIGVLQTILPDQEAKKRIEEKERQLRIAYPEFISKLSLLMGAGLPVRSAFFRMAADYQEKKKQGRFSIMYEELVLVCREMSSGVTERQAYENFGIRCRLPQYRKCAALLVSSLQKGSSGLIAQLQEEVENSFRERKHLAREEGERAGTRLLFPMMMTLAVVMMLILIPACFSFAGI